MLRHSTDIGGHLWPAATDDCPTQDTSQMAGEIASTLWHRGVPPWFMQHAARTPRRRRWSGNL